MLYQKILTEEQPYQLILGRLSGFAEHRHADMEFNYCVRGSFDVIIDKKSYHVNEGEVALISPCVSHSFPPCPNAERQVLTGIVGSTLLKRSFERFANHSFSHPVCRLSDHPDLHLALDEMLSLYAERTEKSELLLTAALYRTCACLLDELACFGETAAQSTADIGTVANIEKALELIYYDYHNALTVEDAAAATGYGKSNFCKLFKRVTGAGFHQALNHRRVRVACGLLAQNDLSIAQIATEVGFAETKTFCRVFKETEGMTPGAYRRALQNE